MSIQFSCDGCGQSLKVPPGSSGKKVRCPQCEEVNIIPESSEPEPSAESSFAATGAFAAGSTPSDNPFAAPTTAPDAPTSFSGELTHGKIEMRDVFEQAWRRYKPEVWKSALFGLIFMGIGFLSGIIGLGNTAAQATGEVALIALVFIAVFIIQQCISAYQQCMGKRYGLNVARGSSEVLNGVFTFDHVFRVILFFLLVGALSLAVGAVVAIPVVLGGVIDAEGLPFQIGLGITVLLAIIATVGGFLFMIRIFLSLFFIVDRDAGIVDAMKQSSMFMKGNSLMVFVTMLVAGIGVMLFTVLTCGIGFFFAYPLAEAMQAVIYLKATGQYKNV